MSSFANADLGSSSDEDDQDFVPSSPKPRNANGKRAADEQDDPSIQKATLEQEQDEARVRKRKAAEAFAAMRDGPVDAQDPATEAAAVKMVEIKRLRRFAGETLEEAVKLPADNPEVIAYLSKLSASTAPEDTGKISDPSPGVPEDKTAAAPPVLDSATSTAPPKRAPPRKKPRQSLEQMSAALDKGKKMTTLEKSQLDWNSHTASDARMQAELESHRRTGGYIEKQEFLERVGDRKEAKSAELGKRR